MLTWYCSSLILGIRSSECSVVLADQPCKSLVKVDKSFSYSSFFIIFFGSEGRVSCVELYFSFFILATSFVCNRRVKLIELFYETKDQRERIR